ncbi:S-methyl-5-thioribose-1-phosphate isomerase [Flavonifractor sp. DFI.6.63]|uniref:S-methyl-5-thioribose-1-phosphate isomerase n=1 Tax=Flavonifractor sp. DFI.6.63 TaxID=2963704 RepID=UPI00210A5AC5|nr:S-methyl-5-thioribose-1-phosphate isomerase [Flavonifractor sp. DFI.6.63]MCQ5029049.1 S-methyl-5-thioribose-1-phosphate isomerase [Flavonifractor sp. DFI.6.63]
MDAIRWEGNTLYLLDQTKLPVTEVWLAYHDWRAVAEAIRTMVVRGAPAIGISAAYAYALAALAGGDLGQAKAGLAASRPTAVNLFWALERMERKASACGGSSDALIAEAKAIHAEDVAMCRAMGAYGAAVVPEHARILTHCNAGALATGGYGTALGVIRAAHEQGKVAMVYADETRPLLQGARLTAYELVADHIPATLIADNMAAALMARGAIDLVVVGCDRMAANGDFANKIGTYSVAVNARYHGVPFYTALPSSTIDLSLSDGSQIPIEQRDKDEVRALGGVQTAPAGVEVYNPAFDVTPHTLLTGVITERGIVYPPFRENLAKRFG